MRSVFYHHVHHIVLYVFAISVIHLLMYNVHTSIIYNIVLTLLLQLWLENRKTASYVSHIRFLHTPFYFHACIDNNNIFKMLTFLLLYLDVNAVMMNVIKDCWGICDTLVHWKFTPLFIPCHQDRNATSRIKTNTQV